MAYRSFDVGTLQQLPNSVEGSMVSVAQGKKSSQCIASLRKPVFVYSVSSVGVFRHARRRVLDWPTNNARPFFSHSSRVLAFIFYYYYLLSLLSSSMTIITYIYNNLSHNILYMVLLLIIITIYYYIIILLLYSSYIPFFASTTINTNASRIVRLVVVWCVCCCLFARPAK